MAIDLYGLLSRLMRLGPGMSREELAGQMVEVVNDLRAGNCSGEEAADILEAIAHLVQGKFSPEKAGS